MQTTTIQTPADKLRAYIHSALSTAGRLAANDRRNGLVTTRVSRVGTDDRFRGVPKRSKLEMEHVAALAALAALEKLAGVKLASCLIPELAEAAPAEEALEELVLD